MRFQNREPQQGFGRHERKIVFLFFLALGLFFLVRLTTKDFWSALSNEQGKVAGVEPAPEADPSQLRDGEVRIGKIRSNTTDPIGFGKIEATVEDRDTNRPRIPKRVIGGIRDLTLGVPEDESDAYYAVLDYARKNTQPTNPAMVVPYTMLTAEPQKYRGELLRVEGRLRRLVPFDAKDSRFDLPKLYDAWIFTPDAGSNPVHVVCSEIPASLRPSDLYLNDPPEVVLTGFFFKSEGYRAKGKDAKIGKLNTAPLILAGSFSLLEPMQVATRDMASEMVPWLWWFAIGVALLLGMVLWNFAASDWTFRHTRAHALTIQPAMQPNFHDVEAIPTGEMLRDLAYEPVPMFAGLEDQAHIQ